MSNTILDHPVARSTDPITSFEAGEGTNARQISHSTVLCLLLTHGEATQGHIVEDAHELRVPAKEQRIRSAFTELERLGFTRRTGDYDESGSRRKELWALTPAGVKEAQK